MKLPAAAYSAEVATSATKAGSSGVSCEILRSRYPPSPRLWRVLLALPTPPKQPLRLRRPEATGYSAKENKLAQEFDITRRQACRDLRRIEGEGHPLTHTHASGKNGQGLQIRHPANLMGTVLLGLAARLQVQLFAIAAVLWIVVKLWVELVVHET